MSNLIEIEQQVIGGLIMSPSLAKQITLEAWHFSSEVYGKIYSEIQALITENTVYDVTTVADRLEKNTGMNYLPQCIDASRVATVKVDLAKHKAEIVRKQAMKRKAMMIIAEGNNLLSSGEDSAVDFIISELMALDKGQDKYEWTMQEAAKAAVSKVEESYKRHLEGGTIGIPTGLSEINEKMGGFHNDFIVIGARPAMGKTAVMLNMAIGTGVRTGLFSSEQGYDQIGERCLAIAGTVSMHNMRSGKMEAEDFDRMMVGADRLLKTNSLINDNPSITIQELVRQARKWKHQDNVDVIFIDYIQRIRSTTRNQKNVTEVMSEVVPALKSLQRELGIPVVALAQVNREVDKRTDKRPLQGDLSDASIIEKEADQIIMLYRDEAYDIDTDQKGIIELNYEKNRHGPTGRIKAAWRGEYLQVRDLAPDHYQ